MRLLMLRLIICSWAIPLSYVVLLPMFYLMSGNIKSEFDNINEFTCDLWAGKA